jgi:hypothetical protein
MKEQKENIVIQYSGEPFNFNEKKCPPFQILPESSSYGLIMGIFLITLFFIKRPRKV